MKCSWLITPIWSASGWISAHAESVGPGKLRVAGIQAARIEKTQGLTRTPTETLTGYWFDRALIVDTIKSFLPQSREALSKEYVRGGTPLEAYCLALRRGKTSENLDVSNGSALSTAEAKATLLEILEVKNAPTRGETEDRIEDYLSTLNEELYGRCSVSTAESYIRLAPAATAASDIVCVLLRIHVPVILRETPTLGKWQVVGSCRISGLMWGAAITGTMPQCRPVRYNGKPEGLVDGQAVGMTDSRDGSNKANPVEMLEGHGIGVVSYKRKSHRLGCFGGCSATGWH